MWQRVTDESGGRIRVLVENASPALRFADFSRYRDAGLDVRLCSCPEADDVCPVTRGEACPHAEHADVVLFGLDTRSPVLRARCDRYPRTPVVVEVRRGEDAELPEGCIPLPFPASVEEQVRVVIGAARRA